MKDFYKCPECGRKLSDDDYGFHLSESEFILSVECPHCKYYAEIAIIPNQMEGEK